MMQSYDRMFKLGIGVFSLLLVIGTNAMAQPVTQQPAAGVESQQGDTIGVDTRAPAVTQPAQKPQQTRTEPVIMETVIDSGAASANNAPQKQPAEELVPALFSLFNYGKTVAIGPVATYFYYNEYIEIDPMVQLFRNEYLRAPQIMGTPKSSEYGTVIGVNFALSRFLPRPHLLIRPRVALLLGMGSTYDGSDMGQLYYDSAGTTVGIQFTPHKDQKDNIFVMGGCDIGYVFSNAALPTAVYSGLDVKLWYRDMILYSDQGNVPPGTTMSETYYWFSIPVGAIIIKPLSGRWLLGAEPRVDLMFFGQMKINESVPGSDVTFDYPAVTLGSKASFRLDVFAQCRLGSSMSLKFGPYAMVYGFGKSNTDTATASMYGQTVGRAAFLEPASASYWVGFNLQAVFLKKQLRNEKTNASGRRE